MASVRKSVLVPYSAQRMFDLVAGVESYPEFLPWCGGARVLQRTSAHSVARLDIDYKGVRQHFTTVNHERPGEEIRIALADGPFRRLEGEWRFRELSPDACKVEFELHYEFKNAVLERLVGPVFGHIASTFIDAFTRRAEDLYGMP